MSQRANAMVRFGIMHRVRSRVRLHSVKGTTSLSRLLAREVTCLRGFIISDLCGTVLTRVSTDVVITAHQCSYTS